MKDKILDLQIQFSEDLSKINSTRDIDEIIDTVNNPNTGLVKELEEVKGVEISNLNNAIDTLQNTIGIDERTGNLSDLTTTEKSNLVAAVNEVNNKLLNGDIILTDSNGIRYKLTVDTSGNLSTVII